MVLSFKVIECSSESNSYPAKNLEKEGKLNYKKNAN